MKRKQPSTKCDNCGRTIALTAAAAVAVKGLLYSAVSTSALRRHKCQHGNWCDECPEHRK